MSLTSLLFATVWAVGSITDFPYGFKIAETFRNGQLAAWNEPSTRAVSPSSNALVFVDNHDSQRNPEIMSFKDGRKYELAQVFTLAYPYGRV